jgi:hypothetical protein
MRQKAALPPLIQVRIQFQPPSSSPPSTEPGPETAATLSSDDVLRKLKLIRHGSRADRVTGKSLTISDIARETGISRVHLHQIACETVPIGPKTRAALSDFFECMKNDGEKDASRRRV